MVVKQVIAIAASCSREAPYGVVHVSVRAMLSFFCVWNELCPFRPFVQLPEPSNS
jgi:hypothetical protein